MSKLMAKVLVVTPVMATAGAYTSGKQIGLLNTLSGICIDPGGPVELESLSLVDKADQKAAIDVLFFGQQPTVTSVDAGTINISDAEMLKCLGHVSIVAGDYTDLSNNAVATKTNLRLMLQAAAGATSLYVLLVSRGTPTYASGDLQLRVGVRQ